MHMHYAGRLHIVISNLEKQIRFRKMGFKGQNSFSTGSASYFRGRSRGLNYHVVNLGAHRELTKVSVI